MAHGLRNPRDDEEVSVVYTSLVQVDPNGYVHVVETMNTPFNGPSARRRAENFMESERERDFTEADGWQWFIWSNSRANEVYGKEMTDALLGRD